MSWLDKIRNKDDSSKASFAFWLALSITLIVIAIWAFNLPYLFESNKNNKQVFSPASTIWNSVKKVFDFGPEVYRAE